jgi:hypothetical protein
LTNGSNDGGPQAAAVYTSLLHEQLVEERSRKTSLEQRGAFVITSSGAIVTLLLTLAAVAVGEDFGITKDARGPFGWALLAFTLAAALGLVANIPIAYKEPTAQSLREVIEAEDLEQESEVAALKVAADARLTTFSSYRAKNGIKAWIVTGALGAEAVGAGLVAWVVWVVASA